MSPFDVDEYRRNLAARGLASPAVDPATQAVGTAAIGMFGLPSKVLGGAIDAAAAPVGRAISSGTGIGISAPAVNPPAPAQPAPAAAGASPPPADALARSRELMQQAGLASRPMPPIRKMSDEKAQAEARHVLGEDAVTKETKSLELEADARDREALMQSSQAKQGGLDSTERLLKIAANRQQIAADDAEDRAASQAVALDAARKQMADTLAALPKDDQVDEGRYWRNQNTGTRVAHGIASFLGNLGEAFAGIKNPVQSMTDAAKEDIAAQAAHYERQRKAGIDKISGLQNIYGMVRQQGFDDEAARKIAENHYYDGMQAKLGAIAARTQNGEEQARAQDGIAQLDKYKAANNKSLEQTIGMMGAKIQNANLSAQYAAQNPQANPKGLHQYSEDRAAAGLPTGEAAVKRLQALQDKNGGKLPGTSGKDRFLSEFAHRDDALGAVARAAMSNDALDADQTLWLMAEQMAKANHQKGDQAVARNYRILRQDGSVEGVKRGVEIGSGQLHGEAANVNMGTDLRVVAAGQAALKDDEAEDADTRAPIPVQKLR